MTFEQEVRALEARAREDGKRQSAMVLHVLAGMLEQYGEGTQQMQVLVNALGGVEVTGAEVRQTQQKKRGFSWPTKGVIN